jgi:hypothetical protein
LKGFEKERVIIGEEDTRPHHRQILVPWLGSVIIRIIGRRKSESSTMFFTTL